MKKFSSLVLEKASVDFNQEMIEELLKKHEEVDVVLKNGERYFITSFMHDKQGKMYNANNIGLEALDKKGKKVEVKYVDIKGIEY
jgi:hypothetical protein